MLSKTPFFPFTFIIRAETNIGATYLLKPAIKFPQRIHWLTPLIISLSSGLCVFRGRWSVNLFPSTNQNRGNLDEFH